MAWMVRAAAALLWGPLAACAVAQGEVRFAIAAAAIFCLVELALALRARAGLRAGSRDASNFAAESVSYTEHDGVLAVSFGSGGKRRASGVVVSRTLRPPPDASTPGGPRVEVTGWRGAIHAGVEDAYLSPQRLRLVVDARAAQALGTDTLCVTLPAGTDQRLLERALGRILRGVPFTSERSMPPAEPELPTRMAS